jgi:hypothetical protein
MRDVLPEKQRTRHDPDAHAAPVHTGCNYDDVSPESIKKSMYNKVFAPCALVPPRVCVRERERERQTDRDRDRER